MRWQLGRCPYRVFSSRGGSGSTYVVRQLGRTGRVFARPDNAWIPVDQGERPAWFDLEREKIEASPETADSEFLMDSGHFDEIRSDYGDLVRRTDGRFTPDPTRTVERNLAELCRWVVDNGHFVLLNRSASARLFSRRRIRDVVFIVRHPTDAYLSLAKPERHGAWVDTTGGLDSERSITEAACRWIEQIDEYERCVELGLDPVLIRYELATDDAASRTGLAPVFSGLRSRSRTPPPAALDQQMRELVGETYERVYPQWEL